MDVAVSRDCGQAAGTQRCRQGYSHR